MMKMSEENTFCSEKMNGGKTLVSERNTVYKTLAEDNLSEQFWGACRESVDSIALRLNLTPIQVVFLAVLVESGEPMNLKQLAASMGCTRLTVMEYARELDALVADRWVSKLMCSELKRKGECYEISDKVVSCLRDDKAYVPESIENLEASEFMNKLVGWVSSGVKKNALAEQSALIMRMAKANLHLPLCRELVALDDDNARMLLLYSPCLLLWHLQTSQGSLYRLAHVDSHLKPRQLQLLACFFCILSSLDLLKRSE